MTNGGVDRSIKCTGHIDAMVAAMKCANEE